VVEIRKSATAKSPPRETPVVSLTVRFVTKQTKSKKRAHQHPSGRPIETPPTFRIVVCILSALAPKVRRNAYAG
jgi:hypothetical protein